MYVTTKYSGYNRHDAQTAAGYFLLLMQPKYDSTKYPAYTTECVCGKTREQHDAENLTRVPDCSQHGIVARLRKLSELAKSDTEEYERVREEMDHLLQEKHDRHVDGCTECDAYKAYYSECRYFRLKSNSYPIRACVRYVRMVQLGHFMMGTARVGKHKLTLSGSYGSDGLPTSVPDEVYDSGVELPQELYDAWNKGGGWNGAGNEAPAMRAWALKTFPNPNRTRGEQR